MTELTDLQLVKAIAKIDKAFDTVNDALKVLEEKRDRWLLRVGSGITTCPYSYQTFIDVYNPLTDKALLFDLMVKYRVNVGHDASEVSLWCNKGKILTFNFSGDDDIPRAILTAIVEANA